MKSSRTAEAENYEEMAKSLCAYAVYQWKNACSHQAKQLIKKQVDNTFESAKLLESKARRV